MSRKRKLLLVDDSAPVRKKVKEAVSELFDEVIEAENGMDALRHFSGIDVDFILTDVEMPSVDGFKLIYSLRGTEKGKDIPIIILAGGRTGTADKIKGLNIGANDYVTKPFEPEELVARVQVLLKMQELQDELRDKNALLEKLTLTDELTGLPNRRYYTKAITDKMALANRHGFHIALLVMDIDFFKKINDSYGHETGDKVLSELGQLMNGALREGELAARVGGEEFVICFYNVTVEGAKGGAERFRKLIEDYQFTTVANDPIDVTVSIGIAVFPAGGTESESRLYSNADEALYQAKRQGRNRWVLFDPEAKEE